MKPFPDRRADEQLVEEIETHLALQEEEYRRAGKSDRDARDAARRAFGNVLKTRQEYRETRGWVWRDHVSQDLRLAIRLLMTNRGFAAVVTLVLGLGIGVNNMMFTIIYAHTLRGLPIPEADRVLMGSFVEGGGPDTLLSWIEYEELLPAATAFDSLAAIGATLPGALGDPHRAPDRYNISYVTANGFDALAIMPLVGRTFTPEDARTDSPVAMLGARAWRARYGADPSIIGRDVLIDGRATMIVGVLPERSGFPSTAEIFVPLTSAPVLSRTDRNARILRVFGRVRRDMSIEAARAQLTTALHSVAGRTGTGARLLPSVTPISVRFFGRPTDPAWMAFITAGVLVLLVSCANVANLMLARGSRRTREMAVRGSLGATRGRMFMQMLTESAVMATLGGAIGLALSLLFVRIFRSFVPADALSYWLHYSMDRTTVLTLVLVAFATLFIFGLLPALQASKTDTMRVLRDGGWTGAGRTAARRWTTAFMTVQIALAVVLLAQGVASWRNGASPSPVDRAIRTPEVLTAALSLTGARYHSLEQRVTFFEALQAQLTAIPGVSDVSLASTLPRQGAAEQRLQLSAQPTDVLDNLPRVWTVSVSPGYFATLHIPLFRGRGFASTDGMATDANGAQPAIVNRRFEELFSADVSIIGRTFTLANPRPGQTRDVTVIGVSENVTQRGESDPIVYLPLAATAPSNIYTLVRSTREGSDLLTELRQAVLVLDPNLPLFRTMTLERAVHDASWNLRVSMLLIRTLIAIVLILSCVGLYATSTQAVYQRAKEFGIRIALGAPPRVLCWLVVKRASVQLALGLVFGVLGAMGWAVAFGAENAASNALGLTHPALLATIVAVLLAVMTIACARPIRHAVRTNPTMTLRED